MRFSFFPPVLVVAWLAGCGGGVAPITGADGGSDLGACSAGCDAGMHGSDGGGGGDLGTGIDAGGDVDLGAGGDASGGTDATTAVDGGSGTDASSAIDAGSVDIDAGSCSGAGSPPSGCCYSDGDCDPGHRCYGASCMFFFSTAGRCEAPPTATDGCWVDADCTGAFGTSSHCSGARICRCGSPCFGPDMPGTCMTGFPFP